MEKLVIIGGGFAGAKIAKNLQTKFDVTLIDTKNYFEFTPSILRTLVEPQHAKKIQVFHKDYLIKGIFFCDTVTNISKTHVITKTRKIYYDKLVICSGSSYSRPFKEENTILANRSEHLIEYHKQLDDAQDVLIVGGGAVGVELAAEISEHYPNIKVTLVHSRNRLLQRMPVSVSNYVQNKLRKLGVNIVYNTRVNEDGKKFKFGNSTLVPDMTFVATGIECHSEFMKKEFSKFLDKRGQIKVNEFMQLTQNIYVAGDVTAIDQEKTAQNAEKQADVVIHNLLHPNKLNKFVNTKTPMLVSLGKWDGVLCAGKFTLKGIIPGLLKDFVEFKSMIKYK